jgi:hypothetical protein
MDRTKHPNDKFRYTEIKHKVQIIEFKITGPCIFSFSTLGILILFYQHSESIKNWLKPYIHTRIYRRPALNHVFIQE